MLTPDKRVPRPSKSTAAATYMQWHLQRMASTSLAAATVMLKLECGECKTENEWQQWQQGPQSTVSQCRRTRDGLQHGQAVGCLCVGFVTGDTAGLAANTVTRTHQHRTPAGTGRHRPIPPAVFGLRGGVLGPSGQVTTGTHVPRVVFAVGSVCSSPANPYRMKTS